MFAQFAREGASVGLYIDVVGSTPHQPHHNRSDPGIPMQTLWGRATQARSSCRCPSCSFAHRSVPRRRISASIAQHMCSSSTGFAVSFSTAVAGASYLDVQYKQKRREELDQSIVDARAEVRAIIEDQETRLRALEERFGQGGGVPTGHTVNQHASSNQNGSAPLEQEIVSLRKIYGNPNTHPRSQELEQLQTRNLHSESIFQEILEECKRALAARDSARVSRSPQNPTSRPQRELWEMPPKKLHDSRRSLMMMMPISRLLHHLDLLQAYMSSKAKHVRQPEESLVSGNTEVETRVRESLQSMERLEYLGWKLSKSLNEGWDDNDTNGETLDPRSYDTYFDELRSHHDMKVCYKRRHSYARQLFETRKQEDALLRLFEHQCNPVELLRRLSDLLKRNEFAPSIHMLNTMIIRLCDRGLPCAARAVLECLRRSPLRANAATDEAALRCALLERDGDLFLNYYDNMKGKNLMGWHHISPDGEMKQQQTVGRVMWGSSPASLGIAAVRTTEGAAEAIIRNYLRQRRIRLALEEYLQFLRRGGTPSLQLMESFLRACHAASDISTGWQIWQQLCFIYEKPSSAAYYWMLNLLAASPKEGNRTADTEASNAAEFQQIAEKLAYTYQMPHPPSYEQFRKLGLQRRELFLLSDDIEELSVRQWVPGMPSEGSVLPDLLEVEASTRHSRRIWPKTLAHFVARQRDLLQKHVEFKGEIHTTRMAQDFFFQLSLSAKEVEPTYSQVLSERQVGVRGLEPTYRKVFSKKQAMVEELESTYRKGFAGVGIKRPLMALQQEREREAGATESETPKEKNRWEQVYDGELSPVSIFRSLKSKFLTCRLFTKMWRQRNHGG
jgi:hypothetical protein